ncbi:craniofacial development protein 2-like [Ostrea edulis]|uniref:craniofacial development protein 2-like n=1 Tax=Ostrea edulis TaxID=37623 RepID=UPI0024AEE2C4|nr:craniofacial development protein 2-like [Ostrea edulis]
MLDKNDNRAERRSALVAPELSRLDVDIAALSEATFPEEGILQEHSAGYSMFWSGKLATEKHLAGVGFMIRTSIVSELENLPTGHSDCVMFMRLPLKNKQYATLFSVYAPTLQVEPAEKDKFYSALRSLLQSTPTDDKLIILCDFNSRVGQDATAWKGVLGKHDVGNCNDNGRMLLELCTEQQLIITNTIFQQKDYLKTAWMHPRCKHWHLIDYVLVRQLRDVLHTRVKSSAECHTDHRLVRCKLRLHFKPKPRRKAPPPKKKPFRLSELQSEEVKAVFQVALLTKLENDICPEDHSPETLWDKLKTAILQTSKEVLGYTSEKSRD